MALLEALVQRGRTAAGQRTEIVRLQCSRGAGEAQLYREVLMIDAHGFCFRRHLRSAAI